MWFHIFQASSFASKYFSGKSESIFSNRLRQNSCGALSPEGVSLSNANMIYNTIDRYSNQTSKVIKMFPLSLILPFHSPINQISSGISNLLSDDFLGRIGPVKQLSYSSMAKKEPLQTIKPQNNLPKHPVIRTNSDLRKLTPTHKVTESALSAGYRFKASHPEADPRYPCDQQLMVGPIPGGCFFSVCVTAENWPMFFTGRASLCLVVFATATPHTSFLNCSAST